MRAASALYWSSPTSFNSFEAQCSLCGICGWARTFTRSRDSTSSRSSRLRNYHYHYSHMVQGKTKGLCKASTRKTRHTAANTKKGQRFYAPKKSDLIKQAALRKVHRASSSSPTSLSNQLHLNRD